MARYSRMSILIRFRKLGYLCENSKYIHGNVKDLLNNNTVYTGWFTRCYAGTIREFLPLEKVLDEKKRQAKRSVVVQVNSEHSFLELHTYCSQFGTVRGVHHYRLLLNGQQHFMLVELENQKLVNELISSCCFSRQVDTIPVESPFLWFRSSKEGKKYSGQKNSGHQDISLSSTNGIESLTNEAVIEQMLKSTSLNDQIEKLYEVTHLNDLGIRLRFMVARQIERALTSLYPEVCVRPFGSSVNGFGKMGCDLDLLLRITSDEEDKNKTSNSRLVFHTKRSTVTGRIQQQRYMEIIGDIVQLFVPGCSQVRRILQARIPIIKYNQDYAGVECDLSMSSMSGIYMSELLYTFGCLDDRVRPLVFAIRKWAQSVGITNPSPGKWITNFPLTLMVIFYLQNATNGPILPNFNLLKKCAEKHDVRITDDFVDCTFLRDINKLNFHLSNNDSLEDLLRQFFEYYASFNFHEYAVSINHGQRMTKPDHSPFYIVNPLENTLNVSKNVSSDESERISMEFRNAAWLLESHGEESKEKYWGLPLLYNQSVQSLNSPYKPLSARRMISVKDLFVGDESTTSNHEVRDMNIADLKKEIEELDGQSNKYDNIVFKNDDLKKQVEDIRKSNHEQLKKTQKVLVDTFLENNHNVWVHRNTKR